MDALLHAISGVLTLIFIGYIGCSFTKIGWINATNKGLFPKLVTTVSLPLFFIYNITHAFSHDQIIKSNHWLNCAFYLYWNLLYSECISGKFMSTKGRRGIFQSTFTTSNTIFVGLPVTMALFGEEAIPYTLLYFFANTTFFGHWVMLVFKLTPKNFHINKCLH